MKFFFRVAMIANICFVITVILRYVEIGQSAKGNDELITLGPVQSILIILGYCSILVNLLFLLAWGFLKMMKSSAPVKHLIWISVFFVLQLIYFFNPQSPL